METRAATACVAGNPAGIETGSPAGLNSGEELEARLRRIGAELFAPSIIGERTSAMLARYDFIDEDTLTYFTARLTQAPRDADFALDYVKRHATTPELRERVCQALVFKTEVLWAQLDALHFAYISPRLPAPGAFIPRAEDAA